MNEICKNKTKAYKLFLILIVYIIAVMFVFNNTVAKINLLASDILMLIFVCAGIYLLYRYSVIGYRYILDENTILIIKIAGKNNEQMQIKINYENILSFSKWDEKKHKKVLNYCATLNKNNRYVIEAKIGNEEYTLVFQPSDEFAKELLKRKDNI